jgi:hypothetical protein
MELTLFDYHIILDMIELPNIKLTNNIKLVDRIQIDNGYEVFEGAVKLSEEFVNISVNLKKINRYQCACLGNTDTILFQYDTISIACTCPS